MCRAAQPPTCRASGALRDGAHSSSTLAIRRCWISPSFRNAMQRRSECESLRSERSARAILGTWLAAGVLATGYGSLITGCTSAAPGNAPMTSHPAGEIDSMEKAEQAWRAGQIAEHEPIWEEEGRPGRRSLLGRSGRLASGVRDRGPRRGRVWPSTPSTRCSTGTPASRSPVHGGASAHALAARDYPVQGLWQIVPGPASSGSTTSGRPSPTSTKRSAPRRTIRSSGLIRGSTYLGMPSIFGGAEEGAHGFRRAGRLDA